MENTSKSYPYIKATIPTSNFDYGPGISLSWWQTHFIPVYIYREIAKQLDASIPFYYWTSTDTYSPDQPSFDQSDEGIHTPEANISVQVKNAYLHEYIINHVIRNVTLFNVD